MSGLLVRATFVLLTFLPPTLPVKAEGENPFRVCMRQLQESGVTGEKAQVGCATSLSPQEFSGCVSKIVATGIPPETALTSCYQVRRPLEMANCVVDIDKKVLQIRESAKGGETPLQLALKTCQRSLLPKRQAECVIGLAISGSNPMTAMETCIKAQDFPDALFPSEKP
ncbi:MAG: hypothetical protein NZ901_12005 [Geminocystis sp.]|nr:hypothetical protein [Geminocystis sp.]HIK37492.1 hypothetical protein [Geminocystis sp. M7585_C2015_104]MCS7148892.1 hypothetical protein [Geminocystis sp.]MCX8078662.1 hypothetical protein [Geminocystis sp.]MDW8116977.1 hypothetical protein [Geminocystis sp.]